MSSLRLVLGLVCLLQAASIGLGQRYRLLNVRGLVQCKTCSDRSNGIAGVTLQLACDGDTYFENTNERGRYTFTVTVRSMTTCAVSVLDSTLPHSCKRAKSRLHREMAVTATGRSIFVLREFVVRPNSCSLGRFPLHHHVHHQHHGGGDRYVSNRSHHHHHGHHFHDRDHSHPDQHHHHHRRQTSPSPPHSAHRFVSPPHHHGSSHGHNHGKSSSPPSHRRRPRSPSPPASGVPGYGEFPPPEQDDDFLPPSPEFEIPEALMPSSAETPAATPIEPVPLVPSRTEINIATPAPAPAPISRLEEAVSPSVMRVETPASPPPAANEVPLSPPAAELKIAPTPTLSPLNPTLQSPPEQQQQQQHTPVFGQTYLPPPEPQQEKNVGTPLGSEQIPQQIAAPLRSQELLPSPPESSEAVLLSPQAGPSGALAPSSEIVLV